MIKKDNIYIIFINKNSIKNINYYNNQLLKIKPNEIIFMFNDINTYNNFYRHNIDTFKQNVNKLKELYKEKLDNSILTSIEKEMFNNFYKNKERRGGIYY